MRSKSSEIILVVVLLVIAGFVRVYYSAGTAPIVVWKSDFGFQDTLVDLDAMMAIPYAERIRDHAPVCEQLSDMGLIEEPDSTGKKPFHRRRMPVDRRAVLKQPEKKIEQPPANGKDNDGVHRAS